MIRKYFYSEKSEGLYSQAFPSEKPTDTAIIFLHGLTGSHRSWNEELLKLNKHAALYFIDLIGSGFSAKPRIQYTTEEHIRYIHEFIKASVKEKKIILVGHSAGSIIALSYTASYPKSITKTFLIAFLYYHSSEEAFHYVSHAQPLKYFAADLLRTRLTCLFLCTIFGPLSRQIIPLFNQDVPRKVVQDYFRHSYRSVMKTLYNVVYKQNIHSQITSEIKDKLILIHGDKDTTAPISFTKEFANRYDIPLYIKKEGTHRLPIYDGEYIRKIIEKEFTKK